MLICEYKDLQVSYVVLFIFTFNIYLFKLKKKMPYIRTTPILNTIVFDNSL